jgi:phage-related protein
MLIDGWDISEANAKQWNVTPAFHDVKNDSEWDSGSPVPAFSNNEINFKTIQVTILIKASGRQLLLNSESNILSRLLEPVDLELDGFDHIFHGIMTKHSLSEKSMKRWHTLTIELDGYEMAKKETKQTFSGTKSFKVTNPGNIVTPAIVEITPSIGAVSIEITGICRRGVTGEDLPVTIKNLTTGNTVTLDGETGLFTEKGELKTGDLEIWALPSLLPGENNITVDNSRMEISVRFYPRYM